MSWITVAVEGSKALGQWQQGQYAAGQSRLQAQADEYQGQIERETALKTAELIRRAGRRQAGAANAAYAGAGVKVGEGSALETERQIYQDSEHDAFQAILEGNRRARGYTTQASMERINASQQETAGIVNAFGSVLQGGQSYMRANGGWKTKG